MSDRSIDADRFAESVEGILSNVRKGAETRMPVAVRTGLRKGANAWRKNARALFKGEYRKSGETIKAGAYARSIRSHMIVGSGSTPSGEIGSPKMPGLAHLLENGHAKVGGGMVAGRVHVAPAADVAFDETEKAAVKAIEEAIDEA